MNKIFTLCTALMLVNHSSATIHFQYFNQFVGNTTSTSKDIDADGTADFKFSPYNGLTTVICLKPSSYYASNGAGFPIAYADGAALGTVQWVSDTGTLRNTNNSTGQFGNNQLYMMVKFSNGTHDFYGWVLLAAGTSGMVIVGYGYNDVPNQAIAPGQETATTGIEEVSASDFRLTKMDKQQIAFDDCRAFDKVSVFDLEGRLVSEINSPIAHQNYNLEFDNKVVVISFYRKEKLLFASKYLSSGL